MSNKIELIKWTIHAIHTPNSINDKCLLCHIPLYIGCPNCSNKQCNISIGKCEHAFHLHCITKWIGELAGSRFCPIDKTLWIEKTNDCERGDLSNFEMKKLH